MPGSLPPCGPLDAPGPCPSPRFPWCPDVLQGRAGRCPVLGGSQPVCPQAQGADLATWAPGVPTSHRKPTQGTGPSGPPSVSLHTALLPEVCAAPASLGQAQRRAGPCVPAAPTGPTLPSGLAQPAGPGLDPSPGRGWSCPPALKERWWRHSTHRGPGEDGGGTCRRHAPPLLTSAAWVGSRARGPASTLSCTDG